MAAILFYIGLYYIVKALFTDNSDSERGGRTIFIPFEDGRMTNEPVNQSNPDHAGAFPHEFDLVDFESGEF